ncbi:MAG: pyridoxamine 5'-phosphate oxidase family protein [Patescibacteria group bacterium]|nr:pyridoxamine 5'-phosphate oxidase family protein [Patescibacteria group bacterium]
MKHKHHILEYLSKNRLMSLATTSRNTPWATTVFFSYENNCDLFFFSNPHTKHCQDIAENPRVAITFNQYWGSPMSVKGLQITGIAAKVSKKDYVHSYATFLARYPWAALFTANHTLYIIKPEEIYYIDQALFKHFHRVRAK